jgi:hypothetical protein
MPRFEPFRGLRYAALSTPIAQVIAPPYDVISSAERAPSFPPHPANAVLVELPEPIWPPAWTATPWPGPLRPLAGGPPPS